MFVSYIILVTFNKTKGIYHKNMNEKIPNTDLELVEIKGALCLTDNKMLLKVDFADETSRLQPHVIKSELLVRASKIKGVARPIAIDATAGLGFDSLLLAAADFEVYMFEKNEVIAKLLEDALTRAKNAKIAGDAEDVSSASNNLLTANVAKRMHLYKTDSVCAMREMSDKIMPHVVYLDPMFPARKKSAAVKKKFQLLHKLELPCEDEGELLDAALSTTARKIVVKRPIKGAYMAGVKPSYSLCGKTIRYDVISR